MTKTEELELQELNTTPEALAAKTAQMEALLNGEPEWMARAKAQTIALDSPEQAEFRRSGLNEQLKASIALVDDGKVPFPSSGVTRVVGKCPVCNKPAEFIDRNRLANCGHVRRSHGKLVLRDEKPSAIAQQPPTKAAEWAERLKTLYETKISRIAELETINDQLQDLSERHAVVANEVDAISEDIEAVYAEMLKGE